MGRRLRLVDRPSDPPVTAAISVPAAAWRTALVIADGDRRRLEVRAASSGVLVEVVVHNRPQP